MAAFELALYHPIAIERRYWNNAGKPTDSLPVESLFLASHRLGATPALADDVVVCPDRVGRQPALNAQCELKGVEALVALRIPQQRGDTTRYGVVAILADKGVGGRKVELHRLDLWLIKREGAWVVVRREESAT
jgi:hypothetical protein